jgi:hypothetical protein
MLEPVDAVDTAAADDAKDGVGHGEPLLFRAKAGVLAPTAPGAIAFAAFTQAQVSVTVRSNWNAKETGYGSS